MPEFLAFAVMCFISVVLESDGLAHHANRKRVTQPASVSMRAFKSARTNENSDAEERILSEFGVSSKLLREMEDMQLFTRAREDELCSISINCLIDDESGRNFLDEKEFRNFNGTCNNLDNFSWGIAGVQHVRLLKDAYHNGKWKARANSVNGTGRNPLPSSRTISNAVHAAGRQNKDVPDQGISLALFYFMQFIDHDLIKTPEGVVNRKKDCCTDRNGFCLPIMVEEDDDYYDAGYCFDARRSFTVKRCNDGSGFRNQINDLTAYMDASMVYGSSQEEANELRSFIGGYLKTSTANFMPEATGDALEHQACDVQPPALCFHAGDKRADVVPGLTTLHTVFMREHNRIAAELGVINSHWSDERIFQEARKIVTAEIQHIAYTHMIPKLLDSTFLSQYGITDTYSYNSSQDASIIQAFSLAYRYHHLMPHEMHMEKLDGKSLKKIESHDQNDTWLDPKYLLKYNYKGVDHIGLGLANSPCPHLDSMMNDASRNYLFADSTGKGFDLATLNIERGRDWGTPAYNQYRVLCGFGNATTWDDLKSTHSDDVIAKLQIPYVSPRDIDLWTGVVTEKPVGSSLSGSTHSCIVAQQFANIRSGDRFWYETDGNEGFNQSGQLTEIKKVTLSRILCDNLDVALMASDVFSTSSPWESCSTFDRMELDKWLENKPM